MQHPLKHTFETEMSPVCDTYYWPQRSWAKVIFLQASVCPRGGRGVCLSAYWDTHPPLEQTPPDQAHTPPGADTPPQTRPPGPDTPPPRSRHPRTRCTPRTRHTPPREPDSGIRSTSGRYASYWNAFLFSELCFWIPNRISVLKNNSYQGVACHSCKEIFVTWISHPNLMRIIIQFVLNSWNYFTLSKSIVHSFVNLFSHYYGELKKVIILWMLF